MNEKLFRCRQMLANVAMCELHDATHELIDKYGVDGALCYLEAQMHVVRDLRNSESEGDSDVF